MLPRDAESACGFHSGFLFVCLGWSAPPLRRPDSSIAHWTARRWSGVVRCDERAFSQRRDFVPGTSNFQMNNEPMRGKYQRSESPLPSLFSATTPLPGQDKPASSGPMSGASWFVVSWLSEVQVQLSEILNSQVSS